MAWTYDPKLVTDKDRVRLLLGDTSSSAPLLQDEEIAGLIAVYGGAHAATIAAARALAAKYSREADKWVGDLKILASQKSKAFLELATALAEGGSPSYGVPSAGGIRISEKENMEDDTNRVSPSFKRDQFPYECED